MRGSFISISGLYAGWWLIISIFSVSAFNLCPSTIHSGFWHSSNPKGTTTAVRLVGNNNDNEHDVVPSSSSDDDKALHKELQKRHEKIKVENARNALEEQHTKSFLKRRPIKLPYKEARKWVQANLGVDTKEEFEDFVAMGYIQTPYIPKNPEKYYRYTKEWISWHHFLKGIFDEDNPVGVEPRRGAFD